MFKEYCTLELHPWVSLYKRAKIAAIHKGITLRQYCVNAVQEDAITSPEFKKINFFEVAREKKKLKKEYKIIKVKVTSQEHELLKARKEETGETIIDLVNRSLNEKLIRDGF